MSDLALALLRAEAGRSVRAGAGAGPAPEPPPTVPEPPEPPQPTGPSGVYRAAVLASGPVAYWPLEDWPGAEWVEDISGNDHPAPVGAQTVLGEAGPWPGWTAIRVAGNNGRMVVEGVAWPVNSFALECWTARSDFSNAFPVGIQDSGGNRYGFAPFALTNSARFQIMIGQTSTTVGGNDVPLDTGWFHYAMTYDGTVRLFVNGAQAAERTLGSPPAGPVGTSSAIGGFSAVTAATGSTISHAAVYDRALTAAEIADHWAAAGG